MHPLVSLKQRCVSTAVGALCALRECDTAQHAAVSPINRRATISKYALLFIYLASTYEYKLPTSS